ncbi:CinA family protein [Chryseobacterium sp. MFBS3-17]|uniref:CinA family protein n=1 Tax=Chryseobacterium sp. MFBS3-17 TaxID=2886689 RepID=UPI001D0F1322|nr:CinA family protein [Chryseobacterium sp. MFBS3-17]MCC2590766.1 CinA family protein [Chryseobacterium sp. MFBS3-17]
MEFQNNLLCHISKVMQAEGLTIAVAESVTSGGLQLAFSQMPDASRIFKGGITAYTLPEKVRLLKVDEAEAGLHDCVSPHIAETMAQNACKLFNSDWAVATTGYCTPTEESGQHLFVYFSFCFQGEIVLTKKLELSPETEGADAQLYYTKFILGCFLTEMNKLEFLTS